MTDIVDPATRSRMMAGIRGKNTRPEVRLRKALHAMGFRFRLHDKRLPGRPDIVLPKWKVAIEVHGCFWHRHEGCRYASTPATRPEFWAEKFTANVARDRRNLENLKEAGWRTAVIWECWLREKDISGLSGELSNWIRSGETEFESAEIQALMSQARRDFEPKDRYRETMNAEEELAPALAELRRMHDVLPFLEQQIPASEAEFRRLPDEMVDVLATSPDFRPPALGCGPVWLQLEAEEGRHAVVIVARPRADGELWVIAPGKAEA